MSQEAAQSNRTEDAARLETNEFLRAGALELRREIVEALYASGGGHYGGCLSVLDVLWTLYHCELRIFPRDPQHPGRDRVILSKGHAALALYAVLRRLGFFSGPLAAYADFRSHLEGHPDMTSTPGIDFSTGSLGQGLSVGIGMAYALRTARRHVWVVLGDGECQEGQVWEAAMLASICGLDNLHAIVDHNSYQEFGRARRAGAEPPPPVPDIRKKWEAFGWAVHECDGHDYSQIRAALAMLKAGARVPTLLI